MGRRAGLLQWKDRSIGIRGFADVIAASHLSVLGTFLVAVLLYVNHVCTSTTRVQVTSKLGHIETEFGCVLSSFALGDALAQITGGSCADRYPTARRQW
jgi:hypothetical protein